MLGPVCMPRLVGLIFRARHVLQVLQGPTPAPCTHCNPSQSVHRIVAKLVQRSAVFQAQSFLKAGLTCDTYFMESNTLGS